MTKTPERIPDEDYKKILSEVPIPCIDILLVCDGEFLLGKRVNKPSQGDWSVFGGRVLKNETMKETAVRKAKDELGLDINESDFNFLTTEETIFDDSIFEDVSSHTINSVFCR